jgi:hypothetical protein
MADDVRYVVMMLMYSTTRTIGGRSCLAKASRAWFHYVVIVIRSWSFPGLAGSVLWMAPTTNLLS